jgi:hypothetical protein
MPRFVLIECSATPRKIDETHPLKPLDSIAGNVGFLDFGNDFRNDNIPKDNLKGLAGVGHCVMPL